MILHGRLDGKSRESRTAHNVGVPQPVSSKPGELFTPSRPIYFLHPAKSRKILGITERSDYEQRAEYSENDGQFSRRVYYVKNQDQNAANSACVSQSAGCETAAFS